MVEGRKREFYLTFSDRVGKPKQFSPLPGTIFLFPSIRSPVENSLYLHPIMHPCHQPPPSQPPSVSLYRIIHPPTPKYHRSVKRCFQGVGPQAVTCSHKRLHTFTHITQTHTNVHDTCPQKQMEAFAFHR